MKKLFTIKRGDEVIGTREQETQLVRSSFVPESFNSDALTVDVVIATDSDVRRRTWDGPIIEVLDCKPESVRQDRLKAGISVLNNHDRFGNVGKVVIGVVDSYRFEEGKLIGTIKLSSREDNKGIVQDIKDGIIRHLSVGYDVLEYQITEKEGETPIYRAVDWEPKEVSFVPIPADAASTVRSEEQSININQSVKAMPETATAGASAPEQVEAARTATAATEPTQTATTPEAAPAPTATATVEGSERSATQIIEAVRSAGLGSDVAVDFITRGVSISDARAEIITKMKNEQTATDTRSAASAGEDKSAAKFRAMEDAIAYRSGAVNELTEGGRDFAGMSLVRMAEEALSTQGVDTRGMSTRKIAETALMTRGIGYQSSSDFPLILGNVVDRKLRAAYAEAPSQWRQFATKSDAVDFREKSSVRIDGMVGEFEKVVEGGEYKYDHSAESGESWKVEKYGKIIAITWEALINDDLGAFNRIPTAIAARAKQKQDNIVWDILVKNQKMSDGQNLFSAGHGNLASAGTALTVESLQAARKTFRTRQVNKQFLNITPTFLIVGPELELQAYQLTSSAYTPVTNGTINPNYNTQLIVIVEPRITDKSWYLSARPGMIDTIEYGFLQGEGELFTERRTGFDVDGLEIKARMVFGAKAVDFKGFYKNPGEA